MSRAISRKSSRMWTLMIPVDPLRRKSRLPLPKSLLPVVRHHPRRSRLLPPQSLPSLKRRRKRDPIARMRIAMLFLSSASLRVLVVSPFNPFLLFRCSPFFFVPLFSLFFGGFFCSRISAIASYFSYPQIVYHHWITPQQTRSPLTPATLSQEAEGRVVLRSTTPSLDPMALMTIKSIEPKQPRPFD